ncbi:MAG: hypothetical protein HC853_01195 [Anaerolineae bacterium]|nr:hypothetical protein [Anaerolineae bacterium]
MKLKLTVLEKWSHLVTYTIDATSLVAAFEQVHSGDLDYDHVERIEDGEEVAGIDDVVFEAKAYFFVCIIEGDEGDLGNQNHAMVVDIEVMGFAHNLKCKLELLTSQSRTVRRLQFGQLQADSLASCWRMIADKQMQPMNPTFIEQTLARIPRDMWPVMTTAWGQELLQKELTQ